MPPKTSSTDATCELCKEVLSTRKSDRPSVIIGRDSTSLFWCARCKGLKRDGWHVKCVHEQLIGHKNLLVQCRVCKQITEFTHESGWFWSAMWLFWASYPRWSFLWIPWWISFSFNRTLDMAAIIIGFLTIVLVRSVARYPDMSAPGVAQTIVAEDMPFHSNALLTHARGDGSGAAAVILTTWAVGWCVISFNIRIFQFVSCVFFRPTRQRARGIIAS